MEQKEAMSTVLHKKQSTAKSHKWLGHFIVNIALLIFGFMTSMTGLVIQIYYHLGHNSPKETIFFLDHARWNSIHVWCSIAFMVILFYHIGAHRRWYENLFKQKLSRKSRPTVILTCLMLISVVSGLIPLLISFFDGNNPLRYHFIEIHDKVAIIFLIVVIAHTMKRFNYYLYVVRNRF